MSSVVTCACPFVPVELILASGLQPRRLVSGQWIQRMPQAEGLCAFVRAYCGSILAVRPALAVFTTLCDQMRRGWEGLLEPPDARLEVGDSPVRVFLLHVPRTLTPAAQEFYRRELERLADCLGEISGRRPGGSDLAEAMRACQAERAEVVNGRTRSVLGEQKPDRPYGLPRPAPLRGSTAKARIRLALAGGPLMQEDAQLLEQVDELGGHVALDATDSGEFFFPLDFEPQALERDPLGELATAYFAIAHPARRPNDAFHARLKQEIARLGIRGIILRRYVRCDTWHAEVACLREQFARETGQERGRDARDTEREPDGSTARPSSPKSELAEVARGTRETPVPVLDLDVDGQAGDAARVRGRLQAFLEVLRGR